MRKIYCNNCKKELKENNRIFICYYKYGEQMYRNKYDLCKNCYKAMKREIPKLLNWRDRLR